MALEDRVKSNAESCSKLAAKLKSHEEEMKAFVRDEQYVSFTETMKRDYINAVDWKDYQASFLDGMQVMLTKKSDVDSVDQLKQRLALIDHKVEKTIEREIHSNFKKSLHFEYLQHFARKQALLDMEQSLKDRLQELVDAEVSALPLKE